MINWPGTQTIRFVLDPSPEFGVLSPEFDISNSVLQYGVRSLGSSVRNLTFQNSVLQYGVRSLSTESGTELDSQIPVRSPLRTQTPYSSTEYGARVRSPVRSPIPRTQYGIYFGLRFRTPVRSTELEYGVRSGARFSDPVRNLFRTQIPYSSTESAPDSNSVLRTPVRDFFPAPYSSTEYGIFKSAPYSSTTAVRHCHPPCIDRNSCIQSISLDTQYMGPFGAWLHFTLYEEGIS